MNNNTRILLSLLCFGLLIGCKMSGSLDAPQSGAAVGKAGSEFRGAITDVEPGEGNTALGSIIGSNIGGQAGDYIRERMKEQSQKIREKVPDAATEQVGEGIHIILDESSKKRFDREKFRITREAKEDLEKLAEIFREHKNTEIVIEGHSDNTESSGFNMTISKTHAQHTANFLVNHGIEKDRLTTKWYGGKQPRSDNEYESGRANNRRVEMAVVASDQLKDEARKAVKE